MHTFSPSEVPAPDLHSPLFEQDLNQNYPSLAGLNREEKYSVSEFLNLGFDSKFLLYFKLINIYKHKVHALTVTVG